MNVPPCYQPGSCTYWLVSTPTALLNDDVGNYCFTTLPGSDVASFNPGCAEKGFFELLQYCDGFNGVANDPGCFRYYSNVVQIFPNGTATESLDSLASTFALGILSNWGDYVYLFMCAVAILIAVYFLNHAVSKS